MSKTQNIINETLKKLLNESFSNLSQSDLIDFIKKGLTGEFSTSSAIDDCGPDENDIINCVLEEFEKQLNDPFPEGLKDFPTTVTIYRLLKLTDINDLDKENLGYSWFTDINVLSSEYFTQQLEHLKGKDVYLKTGSTPQTNVDIYRTLWKRDSNSHENELVVLNDNLVEFVNIKKLR